MFQVRGLVRAQGLGGLLVGVWLTAAMESFRAVYMCTFVLAKRTLAAEFVGAEQVRSWPTAPIPMENPYCSCRLTPRRGGAADPSLGPRGQRGLR